MVPVVSAGPAGQLALCTLLALFVLASMVTAGAASLDRRRTQYVAKPLALALLIAAAVLLGAAGTPHGVAVLVALAFSLTGDVLLLDPPGGAQVSPGHLIAGLAAFLAAHLAYVAAFLLHAPEGPPFPWLALLAMLAAPLLHRVAGRRPLAAAGTLRRPVFAYELTLMTMFVVAWARGSWLVALGATAFVASDFALANRLFVGRRRWHDAFVMLTYHLAQILLVVGLLA